MLGRIARRRNGTKTIADSNSGPTTQAIKGSAEQHGYARNHRRAQVAESHPGQMHCASRDAACAKPFAHFGAHVFVPCRDDHVHRDDHLSRERVTPELLLEARLAENPEIGGAQKPLRDEVGKKREREAECLRAVDSAACRSWEASRM